MLKNGENFRRIYTMLRDGGVEHSPRGLKTLELENFTNVFEPYERFVNFKCRKFNLDYVKKEFLWYLRGNRYDLSICKYAKIWNDCIDGDGGINSNYGQYIFNKHNCQFNVILEELIKDKDSRRAVITILQPYHMLAMCKKDIPCTKSISFRIRDNKLNMTVNMRSQDAIYGFASDIPIFSFIWEMVYVKLKAVYEDLSLGCYWHSVDSFHVYEKHFKMLEELCKGYNYVEIECPKIFSADEVDFLMCRNDTKESINFYFDGLDDDDYKFNKWLWTYDKEDYYNEG
jgi:thymidylate synthase